VLLIDIIEALTARGETYPSEEMMRVTILSLSAFFMRHTYIFCLSSRDAFDVIVDNGLIRPVVDDLVGIVIYHFFGTMAKDIKLLQDRYTTRK
jgi:hypothetical protein